MNNIEITNIIKRQVKKKGYELIEERKSISTSSIYFKISSGTHDLQFRLSDHATRDNVITLRTDKKITPQSVEGFINNRIADLGKRDRRGVLGF